MQLQFDDTFLIEAARDLAEGRGQLGVFLELVHRREDDGLSPGDAVADACEQLGLLRELKAVFERSVDALNEGRDTPVGAVNVHSERALMPTLSVVGGLATYRLAPGALDEFSSVVELLTERLVANPDLQTVTIAAGLGGTGGCAAGECLPEDAAPGPLFERF